MSYTLHWSVLSKDMSTYLVGSCQLTLVWDLLVKIQFGHDNNSAGSICAAGISQSISLGTTDSYTGVKYWIELTKVHPFILKGGLLVLVLFTSE